MKIEKDIIKRFKIYSNYINNIDEEYGTYWKKNDKDFNADLNSDGWINLGRQDFYPSRITEKNNTKISTTVNKVNLQNNEKNNSLIKNIYHFDFLKKKKLFKTDSTKIIEIGAGCGCLPALILNEKKAKIYIIDIPNMIKISSSFLITLFPNLKFIFPNEINNKNDLIDKDVIFLLPSQIDMIEDDYFDLAINNHSFQEMNYKEIKNYFYLIKRSLKNESFFFCSNRLRKETYFFDYDWNILNNFKILFLSKNISHKKYSNFITYIDILLIKKNENESKFKIPLFKKILISNSYNLNERIFWLKNDTKNFIRKIIK
jgi:putative sugar O-methyltransferase